MLPSNLGPQEQKIDLLPKLAAELVAQKVDLIVALYTPCALAAKQATREIPIVAVSGDPVGTGLVPSLARPGGNLTGVSLIAAEMHGKCVELFRDVCFHQYGELQRLVTPRRTFPGARMEVPMIAHRAKPLLLALALGSFWIAGSARAELVRIYVTNSAGDSVHVVDPATNKVVQVFKGPEAMHGIAFAPDGSRVYVSNEHDRTLDVFN
ncbi:MAG: ABC transporter substrate binding protein, partial [Pseudolabrys sp.]